MYTLVYLACLFLEYFTMQKMFYNNKKTFDFLLSFCLIWTIETCYWYENPFGGYYIQEYFLFAWIWLREVKNELPNWSYGQLSFCSDNAQFKLKFMMIFCEIWSEIDGNAQQRPHITFN